MRYTTMIVLILAGCAAPAPQTAEEWTEVAYRKHGAEFVRACIKTVDDSYPHLMTDKTEWACDCAALWIAEHHRWYYSTMGNYSGTANADIDYYWANGHMPEGREEPPMCEGFAREVPPL
ncbi:MAG: hypothetical protein RIC16_06010 [Rhodospirillales bacterium]